MIAHPLAGILFYRSVVSFTSSFAVSAIAPVLAVAALPLQVEATHPNMLICELAAGQRDGFCIQNHDPQKARSTRRLGLNHV
jgi:hypothetical protein|tara:strand:+ start:10377 stop:10622 length:246 start_codon:yes stop_codon:yes gene_type:complete